MCFGRLIRFPPPYAARRPFVFKAPAGSRITPGFDKGPVGSGRPRHVIEECRRRYGFAYDAVGAAVARGGYVGELRISGQHNHRNELDRGGRLYAYPANEFRRGHIGKDGFADHQVVVIFLEEQFCTFGTLDDVVPREAKAPQNLTQYVRGIVIGVDDQRRDLREIQFVFHDATRTSCLPVERYPLDARVLRSLPHKVTPWSFKFGLRSLFGVPPKRSLVNRP